MKAQITTGTATYTVREGVGEDGQLLLGFGTSNPPRGFGEDVWTWEGSVAALSAPSREDGGNRVTVEFRGHTVVLAFDWSGDYPTVKLGAVDCDLEGVQPGEYALVPVGDGKLGPQGGG